MPDLVREPPDLIYRVLKERSGIVSAMEFLFSERILGKPISI